MTASSFLRCTLLVSACVLGLAACTSTPVATQSPQQELSFTNVPPYHVNAARVEVETRYVAGADPKDVASSWAVSPDVAVRRYAENRLQPSDMPGQTGALKFVIDDARVYKTMIQPDNKVVNWVGAGNQDQYEMFLKLAIYYTDDVGMQTGRKGELSFNRTLTMPASVSLAEREKRQLQFLEQLMKDVDVAVAKALSEKFSMVDADAQPLAPLLATP
ncbi:MAG TPA: hypothetical protein VGD95_03945 [Micavibrio sp.]